VRGVKASGPGSNAGSRRATGEQRSVGAGAARRTTTEAAAASAGGALKNLKL
jgi:hypothetical protein